VNKVLVEKLQQLGISAVGLSGLDTVVDKLVEVLGS
jgi:acetylglutamate kinase